MMQWQVCNCIHTCIHHRPQTLSFHEAKEREYRIPTSWKARQLRHCVPFQRHLLEAKSCIFCLSVLYVFLRRFKDLYGYVRNFYAYLGHFCVCDFSKFHHFEPSCRFYLKCHGNCHFSKVA
jgi:hypothetical protein